MFQKIFNVTLKINKFHLETAFKRVRRLSNAPGYEVLSKYCEKEFNAKVDGINLSVSKEVVKKFNYNSKVENLSNIDKTIIECFKEHKILSYNQLVNMLIDKGINTNTATLFVASLTPVLIKVAPQSYCLVGSTFNTGEIDDFVTKIRRKKTETVTDYDYNKDGSIWLAYEINNTNRHGKNFHIFSSLSNILKGKWDVVGMNHKININGIIQRVGNEKFKDKLIIGNEIMFTFNINKRKVEIVSGKNLMMQKYK